MKDRAMYLLIIMLGVLLSLSRAAALCAQSSPPIGWMIETVPDLPENEFSTVGDHNSLALDAAGHPHIAYNAVYYDTVLLDSDLRYAWHDGAEWHIANVEWDIDPGLLYVGEWASLALDTADLPHIAYLTWNGAIGYAHYADDQWHIETVGGTEEKRSISLALDRHNQPHISYEEREDWDTTYLWYARYDGAEWNTERIIEGGRFSSLAVDSLGRPHISDPGTYAWHDGTQWHIEWVEIGPSTSLKLDQSNHPHISFVDGGVDYTWYDGTEWHSEMVDRVGGFLVSTALALDNFDHPHISYLQRSEHSYFNLKHAWHDGKQWYSETVAVDVGNVRFSLAVDEAGYPHMSYQDKRDGVLKYAHKGALPIPALPPCGAALLAAALGAALARFVRHDNRNN